MSLHNLRSPAHYALYFKIHASFGAYLINLNDDRPILSVPKLTYSNCLHTPAQFNYCAIAEPSCDCTYYYYYLLLLLLLLLLTSLSTSSSSLDALIKFYCDLITKLFL